VSFKRVPSALLVFVGDKITRQMVEVVAVQIDGGLLPTFLESWSSVACLSAWILSAEDATRPLSEPCMARCALRERGVDQLTGVCWLWDGMRGRRLVDIRNSLAAPRQ